MNWWPKLVFIVTLGNIVYLSLISLLPATLVLDSISVWGMRIITTVGVAWILRSYHKLMDVKWQWRNLWIFFPYLLILLLRFPIVYPTYDDLAVHLVWGDYANRIWQNGNYMPLELLTYFYLPYDMNYTPLLYAVGIRLTIGILFVLTTIWLMSLYLRLRKLCSGKLQQLFIAMLFVVIPFIPHMMAIQGTLMLEYFTLPFVLEAVYQSLAPTKNKTFAALLVLVAILIKQSHAVFVAMPLLYMLIRYRQTINWKVVIVAMALALTYFARLQLETGNFLSGLFNAVFKSSLYHESNFSNPLFGPKTWIETVIWPVVGQFTDRYAEGVVNLFAKIAFSPIAIIPYVVSLYLALKRKSILFGLIALSYMLWSYLVGYARYYLALNIMAIIFLVVTEGKNWKLTIHPGLTKIILILTMLLSLSSIKTDLSWRPHPSLVTRAANEYYLARYREGLKLAGRDRMPAMALLYRELFEPYEAVLTVYRGPVTMLSYMGYLNGLPVYTAVTEERYERVRGDQRVSEKIKSNLEKSLAHTRILMLVDNYFLPYVSKWQTDLYFDCDKLGGAPSDKYLQRPDYFADTTMYDCTRIPVVSRVEP